MPTDGRDTPSLDVRLPSPLMELPDERAMRHGVRLYMKRDDLVHPEVPGNKWRKLKYNLAAASDQGHTRLLTFGGAFSGHVRAVAAVGHHLGLDTVGLIRGEEHRPLNESLAYAVSRGMRLAYLDRSTYRRKTEPAVLDELIEQFGPCYVVPEGGTNAPGVRGCAELPAEIDVGFDVLCCACGTGGTLAGVASGLQVETQRALGFAVLKGDHFLDAEVRRLQREAFGSHTANWSIDYAFHGGGYAKRTAALNAFVADFNARHGILLDWVYEAKMMLGLFTRIEEGTFDKETTIVAILN